MSFTHFLELRDAERLYVGTRDLADATRGKLVVVIEASGVLYARIFVYRVLRVITHSEMCSREVSESIKSIQTDFIDSWVSVTLESCRIQSLRRRQSPRTPKSAKN